MIVDHGSHLPLNSVRTSPSLSQNGHAGSDSGFDDRISRFERLISLCKSYHICVTPNARADATDFMLHLMKLAVCCCLYVLRFTDEI